MSTQKQIYVNISGRLKVLVDEITGGNARKFATSAGIGSVTFYNYLKGRVPPADALANICESYKVNLNWLVIGTGPKYITDPDHTQFLDPDPEIAELMEGARRVLTSGNHIAFDALERNIRYFDHAIAAEKRADASEKEIKGMKDDMATIRKEMAEMKKQQCKDEKYSQEDQPPNEKVAQNEEFIKKKAI